MGESIYGKGTVPSWKDSWLNDGPDPCLWYGIRCQSNGLVVELNLPNSFLTGAVPKEILLLNHLTKLDLAQNRGLGFGGIELWWMDMDSLEFMDLRETSFMDPVPSEICSSIDKVYAECSVCSCCNRC